MLKAKNRKQRQSNVKKQKPVEPEQKEQEPDANFDFGGLPNRDLKKNLGCG